MLNVLARLKNEATSAETISTTLTLKDEPKSNVQRFISELMAAEVAEREVQSLSYQMKAARFPVHEVSL